MLIVITAHSTSETGKRVSGVNVNGEETSHSLSCFYVLIWERIRSLEARVLLSPSPIPLVKSHALRVLVWLSSVPRLESADRMTMLF